MARGRSTRHRTHDDAARDALANLAAAQGGAFARRQLPEAGVDEHTFLRLRRAGAVRRLRYGAYADAAVIDSVRGDPVAWHLLRASAELLGLARPAALAHVSALALLGVPVPTSSLERLHLWRPSDVDRRGAAAAACSGSSLVAEPALVTRGLPHVHACLAAVQAACDLEPRWGLAACDGVLAAGLGDTEGLHAASATLTSFAGHRRAAMVVGLARSGAESPLESISRWELLRAGLPEPELQVAVHDAAGFVGRVDFLLRELRVVGEADGAGKYQTRADVVAEKVREDRLRACGFAVVRWMWDEMFAEPEAVVARIREAAKLQARLIT